MAIDIPKKFDVSAFVRRNNSFSKDGRLPVNKIPTPEFFEPAKHRNPRKAELRPILQARIKTPEK